VVAAASEDAMDAVWGAPGSSAKNACWAIPTAVASRELLLAGLPEMMASGAELMELEEDEEEDDGEVCGENEERRGASGICEFLVRVSWSRGPFAEKEVEEEREPTNPPAPSEVRRDRRGAAVEEPLADCEKQFPEPDCGEELEEQRLDPLDSRSPLEEGSCLLRKSSTTDSKGMGSSSPSNANCPLLTDWGNRDCMTLISLADSNFWLCGEQDASRDESGRPVRAQR